MNFNMMFRRVLAGMAVFLLSNIFDPSAAWALNRKQIEPGDILIIYSDGSDKDTLDTVYDMVELLTYQGFKLSYGSASESKDQLDKFSYIICYDLTSYPEDFTEKLNRYEKQGSGLDQGGSPHILFVGNGFLKHYLDAADRGDEYERITSTTGIIHYTFDGLDRQTGLVKDEFFLFLKDAGSRRGSLLVDGKSGYMCGSSGALTHIPAADLNNRLVKAIFIKEAARWKWPFHGEPNIFAQYIVINKVYPYQDPDKLLEVVKLLADKKTPFVISVMPMYVNGDYPAMTRFCEILRYAQAHGGAVIINAPINQMTSFQKDTVVEYLGQALEIYNKQGVYPLALEVPRNWLFNEDTIEVMSHFKTIVTSEEKDSYIEPSDRMVNEVYKDGHQWIGSSVALDDLGTSYVSAYSTAVPVSLEEDMAEILKVVNACRNSSIPLKSLWDMDHSYWTEKDLMTYNGHSLVLNGKKKDLSFVPGTYGEKYNYRRNMLQRFSRDLTSQNRMLIVMVGITSLLFLLFIFLARYNNRRNYFLGRSKEENDKP